nr:hypothetical protein [Vibrio coralliirubri]
MNKHVVEKRETRCKLGEAIDVDTHASISVEISLVDVGASEMVPTLFNQLRRTVIAVSADGAYYTKVAARFLK